MHSEPALCRSLVHQTGYATVRNVEPNELTTIAETFGNITSDPRNPFQIRDIRPTPIDTAPPNTLSNLHGISAFPFHTDCAHWEIPANFLFLYCVSPGYGARPTHLIDSQVWPWSESELHSLKNDVWTRGLKNPKLCTVVDSSLGKDFFRFDRACMKPKSRHAQTSLTAIREKIDASEVTTILWSAKLLLIVDNHRLLHSRGISLVTDLDRLHQRLLIGGKP